MLRRCSLSKFISSTSAEPMISYSATIKFSFTNNAQILNWNVKATLYSNLMKYSKILSTTLMISVQLL